MKTIGFFVCHFSERGTEVAIYDYADHNETLLGNKSIIYCFTPQRQAELRYPPNRESYYKFKNRFQIIEISDFSEIKGIDIFYTLVHGAKPDSYNFDLDVWKNMRTVKHCVFDVSGKEGDVYCVISDQLNRKYGSNLPVIPHMVCIGKTTEDLRSNLNIPKEAIVYGRYGGYPTFNVGIARQAVIDVACQDTNKFFLFMNTPKFCNLPNVIFLEGSTDMEVKRRFINTCDAFLHGRSDGETFGLAVAEFALCLKPIVSNAQCTDDAHFQILGNQIIKYHSKDELVNILKTFVPASFDMSNNGYLQYTPEKVMKIFNEVIITD
jgi:glycosyltransferase involved in cell wall biosynthesis